ncbi:MAG: ATP-binding protein [Bacillota bacterium]
MGYITRDLERVVLEVTGQYPVLFVEGPRQVGKTTMLQTLAEQSDRTYVTLDDLTVRGLARTDPATFFQIYRPPVLVDEVQYAPELFPRIKLLADQRRRPGDFWLTGSQVFSSMEGIRESLAGRVAILTLSPLSQSEIYSPGAGRPFVPEMDALLARQEVTQPADTPEMYRRIFRGSMPAVASGKYKDPAVFYSSYVSTYVERDVRSMSPSIDALKFADFMASVAARCGQIVNVADIARDADVTQPTAKHWLRILEACGIVFFLHPYSNNQLKRTISAPKLYFNDTGLVCYLGKWSSAETAERGAMSGALLENYVVSEIVKSYRNAARVPFVYYYRDRDAKEIDLILEADGVLMPIEVKKTASPDARLVKVFSVLSRSAVPRGKGAVICMTQHLSAIDKDNLVVPVSLV